MKQSKNHGGPRPGAGRRPTGRITISIRVTPDFRAWLLATSARELLTPGETIETICRRQSSRT